MIRAAFLAALLCAVAGAAWAAESVIVEWHIFTPKVQLHVEMIHLAGKCFSGEVEWPARVDGDRITCYTADMPIIPTWYQRLGDWLLGVAGLKKEMQP